MHQTTYSTPAGFVAALNLDLIAAAAARRQAVGKGAGVRSEPSLAAGSVDLIEIHDIDGRGEITATARGEKTARRRAPAFLSRYHDHDGRRLAALRYLASVERIGGMKGSALSIEADISGGSGGISDGGVTSRVQDVKLVQMVHGLVNRWKWDPVCRDFVRTVPRVVLLPRRGADRHPARRPITAVALLNGILIDGLSMAEILRRFGWSVQSKQRDTLTESAEEMLELIADKLGLSARVMRN
ncbi:hypothetical protein [Ruegeria lacuscaerulensis]|uniref:hypothetical protein n=1 Tax=Ruegeria lacuscaerulensis TaxID=55218 RepID=UPI00147D88DD|nr:hypothetical protein [Ruegeria lacuscaerulensis]